MKKIITAIGNINLNKKLKEKDNIQVIGTDIQYQEGVLELLEKEKNIDFLILSEKIQGEFNIIELIEKIKNIHKTINIILILENKKTEIENILIAKGIYKIIYHNEVEIKEISQMICNEKDNNENEELKKEINNLKQLILENSQNKNSRVRNKKTINKQNNQNLINNLKYKKIKYITKKLISKIIPYENLFKKKLNSNQTKLNQKEIISIIGPSGVGKSIISVNLAKSLGYQKEKVLMIDFDILNNSLHTILGVKKYPPKIEKEIKSNTIKNVGNQKIDSINVENLMIKINKKIDLISITSLIFQTKEKLSFVQIEKILNQLKEKYNTIIIDTSSECFFDITKNIIKLSHKNIL